MYGKINNIDETTYKNIVAPPKWIFEYSLRTIPFNCKQKQKKSIYLTKSMKAFGREKGAKSYTIR